MDHWSIRNEVPSGELVEVGSDDDGDFEVIKVKRQKVAPIHLTQQQEEDIIDWYKSKPCLYDKGKADFKLREMKEELWEEKAKIVADGKYSGKAKKEKYVCLLSHAEIRVGRSEIIFLKFFFL